MLEHRTGMMGLPLRLLAREVYDRISASSGESQVALVTGEEKRVPPRPRYWVCTVEAMPMDTPVEFLAIDEVQLAAHPERGHVFTDRLLHARGSKETWFMGAETMRDAIEEIIPAAEIRRSPRLSVLKGSGSWTLATLPKRSAVVAFSLPRVFELAERLRNKRGGAAVVIGALSPRARNAQVAMYQAGEVDFLVATDAIGMGLNLDIDHVAFADLRKFDGQTARDLDPAEIAQIAGRAGRYVRDGTFGTLLSSGGAASGGAPMQELSPALVRAIEQHRFAGVRSLWWRNADLDFASIDALRESLREGSPSPRMKRMDRATDQAVLGALAERASVRSRVRDEELVSALWDACSIPDYRQILFEDHVALVERVFVELVDRGSLAAAPIERELDRLRAEAPDLDTLMDHIASIRTWNYIANQRGWIDGAAGIRDRARAIEDELSDALHAQLVDRFVDRSRKRAGKPASSARAVPRPDPSSPFAALVALAEKLPAGPAGQEPKVEASLVERLIESTHEGISIGAGGSVVFEGERIGKLVRGRSLATPEVVVTVDATPGEKLRLSRRLLAWSRDLVQELVGPVAAIDDLGSTGRGLAHALAGTFGTILARDVAPQLEALTEADRARLAQAGVVFGSVVVYVAANLKPDRIADRVGLVSAHLGIVPPAAGARPSPLPRGHERSIPLLRGVPDAIHTAMGFPVVGRRAIRADVLQRLANRLDQAALRGEPAPPATKIASWLGSKPSEAEEIAKALEGRPQGSSSASPREEITPEPDEVDLA